MPRAYPEEFRQRAVELARQRAKPVSQIAADLGIAQSVLHRWVRQADIDAGQLPDVPHHAVLFQPDGPGALWVGNDAGVFLSRDGDRKSTRLNSSH